MTKGISQHKNWCWVLNLVICRTKTQVKKGESIPCSGYFFSDSIYIYITPKKWGTMEKGKDTQKNLTVFSNHIGRGSMTAIIDCCVLSVG